MQLFIWNPYLWAFRREREGKRTVANLRGLFLFFVKYFNHLEKDFDTDNTGNYKGFQKSVCLEQAKNLKTRHFSQSFFFECHPESLKWRCFAVSWKLQKQPPRGELKKRCSENMQQIYRRTPMSKYDFNKVALQLYWNRTSAWVFSCKIAAYFQSTSGRLHLKLHDAKTIKSYG